MVERRGAKKTTCKQPASNLEKSRESPENTDKLPLPEVPGRILREPVGKWRRLGQEISSRDSINGGHAWPWGPVPYALLRRAPEEE